MFSKLFTCAHPNALAAGTRRRGRNFAGYLTTLLPPLLSFAASPPMAAADNDHASARASMVEEQLRSPLRGITERL